MHDARHVTCMLHYCFLQLKFLFKDMQLTKVLAFYLVIDAVTYAMNTTFGQWLCAVAASPSSSTMSFNLLSPHAQSYCSAFFEMLCSLCGTVCLPCKIGADS